MTQEETAELVWQMLGQAVDGDTAGAATTLQTIGMNADDHRMYGVCCALASAGTQILHQVYGEHAPRPGTSDMYVFQELEHGAVNRDPAKAFAIRFLTAYANGDTQTTLALFNAALAASDEQYVSSTAALLANVAGLARLALEKRT